MTLVLNHWDGHDSTGYESILEFLQAVTPNTVVVDILSIAIAIQVGSYRSRFHITQSWAIPVTYDSSPLHRGHGHLSQIIFAH